MKIFLGLGSSRGTARRMIATTIKPTRALN